MKKNSFFAALFLCSLALITHNAPYSVKGSIAYPIYSTCAHPANVLCF